MFSSQKQHIKKTTEQEIIEERRTKQVGCVFVEKLCYVLYKEMRIGRDAN